MSLQPSGLKKSTPNAFNKGWRFTAPTDTNAYFEIGRSWKDWSSETRITWSLLYALCGVPIAIYARE
jgi:hypothetical protein